MADPYDDGGLGGYGASILGGQLGAVPGAVPGTVPGNTVTSTQSMPTLEDLLMANRDQMATDPYGMLTRMRAGRQVGGYAPASSGVKYIFTGGSPYKRTASDKLAEAAIVIGALRARAAERRREAERKKAEAKAKAVP